MQTIEMGDVSITRVVEWAGPVATVDVNVPESPPELWENHKLWLAPDFWTPETNADQASMHSSLLRSAGENIIVDTGVGTNKSRPNLPDLDMMKTGYLDALAAAGIAPEDVDLVINTHLHIDHVGWNIVEENREWVPTFLNASYLFCKPDVEYWRPDAATRPHGWAANVNVYENSVEPVFQAGQAQVWDDSFQIDKNLRIDLAPGHTPGLGVIALCPRVSALSWWPIYRTAQCSSSILVRTIVSARMPRRCAVRASGFSVGPPTTVPSSCLRTSLATVHARSQATAATLRSSRGHPSTTSVRPDLHDAAETVAQTAFGPVRGQTRGEITVFHAVPYPSTPSGASRFAEPEPPTHNIKTEDHRW